MLTPGSMLLIGNVTLTNDMIWIHSQLHSFLTARCMTHLSVAESRRRRRDKCSEFLERNVAEKKVADGTTIEKYERKHI